MKQKKKRPPTWTFQGIFLFAGSARAQSAAGHGRAGPQEQAVFRSVCNTCLMSFRMHFTRAFQKTYFLTG